MPGSSFEGRGPSFEGRPVVSHSWGRFVGPSFEGPGFVSKPCDRGAVRQGARGPSFSSFEGPSGPNCYRFEGRGPALYRFMPSDYAHQADGPEADDDDGPSWAGAVVCFEGCKQRCIFDDGPSGPGFVSGRFKGPIGFVNGFEGPTGRRRKVSFGPGRITIGPICSGPSCYRGPMISGPGFVGRQGFEGRGPSGPKDRGRR